MSEEEKTTLENVRDLNKDLGDKDGKVTCNECGHVSDNYMPQHINHALRHVDDKEETYFVLYYDEPYENSTILGIFSSLENAKRQHKNSVHDTIKDMSWQIDEYYINSLLARSYVYDENSDGSDVWTKVYDRIPS